MVNPKQTITVQGEGVEILITPSMYKAASVRGLDLSVHGGEDGGEIWSLYVKHLYLAYLNARDIAQYEGRKVGKELSLSDLEAWAYGEGKERFAQFIRDFLFLRTGKTLDELMNEKVDEGKKKAKVKRFRLWLHGNR
jgi:hypothetical protein